MHALHGNTTSIKGKLLTAGMPVLPKSAKGIEDFIEWMLDFEAWCEVDSTTSKIIGPLRLRVTRMLIGQRDFDTFAPPSRIRTWQVQ